MDRLDLLVAALLVSGIGTVGVGRHYHLREDLATEHHVAEVALVLGQPAIAVVVELLESEEVGWGMGHRSALRVGLRPTGGL